MYKKETTYMYFKDFFNTALNTASDMCEDDSILVSLAGAICQILILLAAAMAIFAFIATYLLMLLYVFCGDGWLGRTAILGIVLSPFIPLAVRMYKDAR